MIKAVKHTQTTLRKHKKTNGIKGAGVLPGRALRPVFTVVTMWKEESLLLTAFAGF